MKKVDFTLHNNLDASYFYGTLSSVKEKPAVIKETFVRPINFVGRLRVPRLKLTSGVLPLLIIKPSERSYTAAEHAKITSLGLTPTDIIYGLLWYKGHGLSRTVVIPGNGNVYSFTIDDTKTTRINPWLANAYPCLTRRVTANCIGYAHLFINERPIWEQNTASSWKLKNNPRILHDWNELSTNSENFMLYVHGTDDFKYSSAEITFSDNCLRIHHNIVVEATEEFYTTPVFFCSDYLSRFVSPIDIQQPFRFEQTVLDSLGDDSIDQRVLFYTPTTNYTFSPQLQSFIASSSVPPGITTLDYSNTVTLPFNRLREQLNPYQSLLITSDELNYNGESITINTVDVNGVISPSSLSILKSYVIGTDENGRSDFVFYDDHLSQTPALINNPSLAQLTLRFFILTKENQIIPLTVPPGQAIFVQLAIEP